MTTKKTAFQKIKDGKEAIADVAQAALDGAADFHTESDNQPVKESRKWAKRSRSDRAQAEMMALSGFGPDILCSV